MEDFGPNENPETESPMCHLDFMTESRLCEPALAIHKLLVAAEIVAEVLTTVPGRSN